MLKDIIKKEIVETITSAKFVFTFLLCAVLILLSVYTGLSNYKSDQKEYSAAVGLNQRNLESQPTYQSLAGLGTKIARPPQVLGAIASGVNEAVGRVASVNIAYDPNLVDSKYESNPVFSVFGALDLTYIVKIVLSLFAILFTYDAIVGEKEKGTLKLMLSNKVPRDRLIMGKVIGGFISLLIPLIIPLILSLLMIMAYPGIALGGADWIRLLLMFLMFFLYLSVFFTLGILVSSRTNKSSTSFLVLLVRHDHPQALGRDRRALQAHSLGPRDYGQKRRLSPADPGRGPEKGYGLGQGEHPEDEGGPGRIPGQAEEIP
jgi:ABC-type Na+ efflux pump permease subunit